MTSISTLTLNYRYRSTPEQHYVMNATDIDRQKETVVLLHGLFGSLDNLGILARDLLQQGYGVLQIDLRNHGLSPHATQMNYDCMAADVIALLDKLAIKTFRIIGHSMGGKVTMKIVDLLRDQVQQPVIIDIAPVTYTERRHDDIFAAINTVTALNITDRQHAAIAMRHYLHDDSVIQFLLKSFQQGQWRFNVPVLWQSYPTISHWQPIVPWPKPILFIRGSLSGYLDRRYRQPLVNQFPHSQAYVINGCSHWVHAEQPHTVLRAIYRFWQKSIAE